MSTDRRARATPGPRGDTSDRAARSRIDPQTGSQRSGQPGRTDAVDGSPATWRQRLGEPSLSMSLQRLAGNRAVSSLATQRDPADQASGPQVQDDPGFTGPLTEEQEADLKDTAQQLASHMQAAWIDASTQGAGWIAAASDFGLCYKEAFDRHESVREEQERADKLVADVAFGVLTVVSGGALGSLATIAKNGNFFKTMTDWKADGILEVMKGTAGKTVEAIGQPEVKSHKVATDPLKFYLDLKNAVDHQVAATTNYLNKYVQRYDAYVAGDRPLHDLYGVDPKAVRDQVNAWKKTQTLFKQPPEIDKEGLTNELEIGMWAKWVPGLRTVTRRMAHCSGTVYTDVSYSGPGGYVEDRIKALKIPGFPTDIDWGTFWMGDSDVKKLIAWGQGWTPSTTFDLG